MAKPENQAADNSAIQVFELTMDNPEDQDELNRKLHKPGETTPAMSGRSVKDESATESTK